MKNPESPQHADEANSTRKFQYGDQPLLADESVVDWIDRINRRAYRRSLANRFVGANTDLRRKFEKN